MEEEVGERTGRAKEKRRNGRRVERGMGEGKRGGTCSIGWGTQLALFSDHKPSPSHEIPDLPFFL